MRPLLKLQKISVGVNENRILQLAGMEKERKNTYQRKGVRTRKPSFNIQFILILKCRSYFNVSNVKIK